MDYSSVIVAIIVLLALFYCAQTARRKFRSLHNAPSANTQDSSACGPCAGACRK